MKLALGLSAGILGECWRWPKDAATKWEYEAKIARRFGFEQQLELPIPPPPAIRQEAAN